MYDKPSPTQEFSPEEKAAFALAGTVALPSPFPASARILLGIMPQLETAVAPRYYLKIIELVTDRFSVTRLVSLGDLRAIRLVPESGRFDNFREWTLLTAEDLHDRLERAKGLLKEARKHDRRGV